MPRHVQAKNKKYPPHDSQVAIVRIEDVTTVPVNRLMRVVVLIAFARIVVENISLGITQPNGPNPSEKNDTYIAKPVMTFVGLLTAAKKSDAITSNASIHPDNEMNIMGLRPNLSNKGAAMKIHESFSKPSPVKNVA
mmetsp:Transcript_18610/g.25825  ORF Transcript_18610/g.25825 Transcript_18610/m.25825 type:complete len:137 (-) Transcript_18610:45-455(-)